MADIPALLEASLPTVAALCGGDHGRDRPLQFFDGFWDFVVQERDVLQGSSTWHVMGCTRSLPWFFLCVRLSGALDEPWQVHLFVELKAPVGSGPAPWPVSTIDLRDGARSEPGPSERQRPVSIETHAALRCLGLDVKLGYWGIHLSAAGVAARVFIERGAARWQRMIELGVQAGIEIDAAETCGTVT